MRNWLIAMGLVGCVSMAVFGRAHIVSASTNMSEDDFRKLEQNWLDAAAAPDLPSLRRIIADDFMGTSFGGRVLSKDDIVPAEGVAANHLPKSTLRDSTVHLFGDTAVLMGTVEMQVPQKAETIRMTTVFQEHGGDWQVIAVHMSKTE
jgi:ketosteroid isomerase-like protein